MSNPTSPSEPTDLNPLAIIETLDRHQVNYLLVGGLGAAVHGATRPTYDFDALAERTDDNLDRLAKALNELGAFYRVGGLTDDEARALPTVIDRHTLLNSTITTWRTNAGDLDIMTEMTVGPGRPRTYHDLYDASSVATLRGGPLRIAALDDIIASKRHAHRGKDQAALPELERIARRINREPENADGIDLD